MNDIIQTIINQIGGKQTFFMVDAKNITYDNKTNKLMFKFMRSGKTKANWVKIMYLPGKDLYSVQFLKVFKTEVKEVTNFQDVYGDQLRGLFESTTGLRTSLTAVYA